MSAIPPTLLAAVQLVLHTALEILLEIIQKKNKTKRLLIAYWTLSRWSLSFLRKGKLSITWNRKFAEWNRKNKQNIKKSFLLENSHEIPKFVDRKAPIFSGMFLRRTISKSSQTFLMATTSKFSIASVQFTSWAWQRASSKDAGW